MQSNIELFRWPLPLDWTWEIEDVPERHGSFWVAHHRACNRAQWPWTQVQLNGDEERAHAAVVARNTAERPTKR